MLVNSKGRMGQVKRDINQDRRSRGQTMRGTLAMVRPTLSTKAMQIPTRLRRDMGGNRTTCLRIQ